MKLNPDGSIEGTPEELAAYQRAQVSEGTMALPHSPQCSLEIARRGWWSVVAPVCTCGAAGLRIATITTGNSAGGQAT